MVKTFQILVGIIAFTVLWFLYYIPTNLLFGWQHGGGALPMVVFAFVSSVAVKKITRIAGEWASNYSAPNNSNHSGGNETRPIHEKDLGLSAFQSETNESKDGIALTECNTNNDELFEKIGYELESNERDVGVWTRAFMDANGDETETKVRYLRYRFEKLKQLSSLPSSNTEQSNEPEQYFLTQDCVKAPLNIPVDTDNKTGGPILTDEETQYLGTPILAMDYVRKYRVTEDDLAIAVSKGHMRSVNSGGNLWVQDNILIVKKLSAIEWFAILIILAALFEGLAEFLNKY